MRKVEEVAPLRNPGLVLPRESTEQSTFYNADVVKSRLLRRCSTESSTMQMMVCADVHLCRKDLTWEHFAPLLILVAMWRIRVELISFCYLTSSFCLFNLSQKPGLRIANCDNDTDSIQQYGLNCTVSFLNVNISNPLE